MCGTLMVGVTEQPGFKSCVGGLGGGGLPYETDRDARRLA